MADENRYLVLQNDARVYALRHLNEYVTHLTSGDMKLNLSARSGVNPLISQSTHFMDILR